MFVIFTTIKQLKPKIYQAINRICKYNQISQKNNQNDAIIRISITKTIAFDGVQISKSSCRIDETNKTLMN